MQELLYCRSHAGVQRMGCLQLTFGSNDFIDNFKIKGMVMGFPSRSDDIKNPPAMQETPV